MLIIAYIHHYTVGMGEGQTSWLSHILFGILKIRYHLCSWSRLCKSECVVASFFSWSLPFPQWIFPIFLSPSPVDGAISYSTVPSPYLMHRGGPVTQAEISI